MASLKDINASIEEGNEDLQRLNSNFAAWLNMQKTSGDDLEAKAEKRTAKKKKGGITNIFKRDMKSKSKGGLFGTGIGLKGLAIIAAVIAPVIFDLFKKEIKDQLKLLFGGDSLKDIITRLWNETFGKPSDGGLDTDVPGARVRTNYKFSRFLSQLGPNKLNPNGAAKIQNNNSTTTSKGGSTTTGTNNTKIKNINGVKTIVAGPNKGGQVFNNAFSIKGKKGFQSMNSGANAPAGTGIGPATAAAMANTNKRGKLSRVLNALRSQFAIGGSETNFFYRFMEGIRRYIPKWIQKCLGFLVKSAVKWGARFLTIFEIGLVLFDMEYVEGSIMIQEKKKKLGMLQKAVVIVSLISAFAVSVLAGILGGIIGTVTLGPIYGTVIGGAIFSYYGYTQSAKIILHVLNYFFLGKQQWINSLTKEEKEKAVEANAAGKGPSRSNRPAVAGFPTNAQGMLEPGSYGNMLNNISIADFARADRVTLGQRLSGDKNNAPMDPRQAYKLEGEKIRKVIKRRGMTPFLAGTLQSNSYAQFAASHQQGFGSSVTASPGQMSYQELENLRNGQSSFGTQTNLQSAMLNSPGHPANSSPVIVPIIGDTVGDSSFTQLAMHINGNNEFNSVNRTQDKIYMPLGGTFA